MAWKAAVKVFFIWKCNDGRAGRAVRRAALVAMCHAGCSWLMAQGDATYFYRCYVSPTDQRRPVATAVSWDSTEVIDGMMCSAGADVRFIQLRLKKGVRYHVSFWQRDRKIGSSEAYLNLGSPSVELVRNLRADRSAFRLDDAPYGTVMVVLRTENKDFAPDRQPYVITETTDGGVLERSVGEDPDGEIRFFAEPGHSYAVKCYIGGKLYRTQFKVDEQGRCTTHELKDAGAAMPCEYGYSAWGPCVNGVRERTVLSVGPSSCDASIRAPVLRSDSAALLHELTPADLVFHDTLHLSQPASCRGYFVSMRILDVGCQAVEVKCACGGTVSPAQSPVVRTVSNPSTAALSSCQQWNVLLDDSVPRRLVAGTPFLSAFFDIGECEEGAIYKVRQQSLLDTGDVGVLRLNSMVKVVVHTDTARLRVEGLDGAPHRLGKEKVHLPFLMTGLKPGRTEFVLQAFTLTCDGEWKQYPENTFTYAVDVVMDPNAAKQEVQGFCTQCLLDYAKSIAAGMAALTALIGYFKGWFGRFFKRKHIEGTGEQEKDLEAANGDTP